MVVANECTQNAERRPQPVLTEPATNVQALAHGLGARSDSWSDAELLARMIGRQPRAWREFTRRFEALIKACVRRILARFEAVRSSSDLDEVYAMLMDRLCANDMYPLRAFEEGRGVRFSTWIGLLARNVTFDLLRIRAQERRLSEFAAAQDRPLLADTPESLLELRERMGQVAEHLEKLSPRDQTFVRLFFVEHLPADEIAREMSITLSTVYSKKHKLHDRLQTAMRAHTRSARSTSRAGQLAAP